MKFLRGPRGRAGGAEASEPERVGDDGIRGQETDGADTGIDTAGVTAGQERTAAWWRSTLPGSFRVRVAFCTLLVLVIAAGSAVVVHDVVNRLPGDAALRVGEEVVTEQELQQRVEVLGGLYGVQPPEDPDKRDTFNRDAAKSVAVSKILDRTAQQEGIEVGEKEARDQLATVIDENFQGKREAFTQMLGEQGISEQDVLDEISRQLRNTRMFAKVTESAEQATDEDARTYYEENDKEMVSPEQRRISNIVLESQKAAEDVAKQARGGADFAALVEEYTIDEQTRNEGGDLGWVKKQDLESDYAGAAFGAEPGDVFGPVQSQGGWNVGKVTEVEEATQLSFEEVQDDLKARLDRNAQVELWREWLGDKIAAADVEYASQYRPDDPEAPPEDLTNR
ncbi:peptidyl-prolyl cis-trans isomerase C [Haloechinothrix alba]|uniref:Peptidyl-prolyl cis-trans isomerase C n=1 Tax=Haloechinothrix alba TaxID=664784 RepID=A0A238XMX3_9PSEU|nr:peptidyl-prolyl cis-trans isomerase [Haloechinothrix alba]SNR60325.1 peptidyl-prolyl cis-trans isomerase C [Haloechinothrix alba]